MEKYFERFEILIFILICAIIVTVITELSSHPPISRNLFVSVAVSYKENLEYWLSISTWSAIIQIQVYT